MSTAFVALVGMFAVSLVGGTLLDEVPDAKPVHRGGWRVLEADFHAHTRLSDGFLSPLDIVLHAKRRRLDVLAVTEHNMILAGQIAKTWSEFTNGPTVLVGEEVTTNRFHLIGVGLKHRVEASQSVRGVLEAIHRDGAIAIAAHPVERYWETYEPVRDQLDAAELMHPIAYGRSARGWRWDQMRDFYLREKRLTAIGSSDFHFGSPLGITRTLVFAKSSSEGDVLDALRNGRTVVHDLSGRPYGDPQLIQALVEDPYEPREQDYNYRGTGVADRVLRALGWLSVLGLLLVAPRRSAHALLRDAGIQEPEF